MRAAAGLPDLRKTKSGVKQGWSDERKVVCTRTHDTMFCNHVYFSWCTHRPSNHAVPHPQLHRRATVGTGLH